MYLPSFLILALRSLQVEVAHASCSNLVVFYLWLLARLACMTLTISKKATNKRKLPPIGRMYLFQPNYSPIYNLQLYKI